MARFHRAHIRVSSKLRTIAVLAIAAGVALLSPVSVQAAPSDYQFPSPVYGTSVVPGIGWLGFGGGWVVARTDPSTPGVTRFLTDPKLGCMCEVHWQNPTTGASGVTEVGADYDYLPQPRYGFANTGSGFVVGSVWIKGYQPVTWLPTVGVWNVP